ncbi:MAG TPA: metalloregulator ArsR/SmtB family transcription factor [Mycobacteriales bacterium]|nr:metalloregulator ArsR/SmtB family transcription factor [Mycobacteriales bacterium]
MARAAPIIGSIPDVLKALSDEMRWSIVTQLAAVDELACMRLEQTLPVSKPTISYHVKVLYHAGLLEVRKEGRNYFYRLRRDVLDAVLAGVARELGPAPAGTAPARAVPARAAPARAARPARAGRAASPDVARTRPR